MDFCPLPFDDFYIDNIDLASKYFHITPIPHPRTADGFDDKVVSAHRILEQVRAAQPKVDTEELIKDAIYAKATMGRRDHMCQALIASNRRAFEIGWAGALEHLGLLDPNKKVNYLPDLLKTLINAAAGHKSRNSTAGVCPSASGIHPSACIIDRLGSRFRSHT
jgi:hypothetical protein